VQLADYTKHYDRDVLRQKIVVPGLIGEISPIFTAVDSLRNFAAFCYLSTAHSNE